MERFFQIRKQGWGGGGLRVNDFLPRAQGPVPLLKSVTILKEALRQALIKHLEASRW